MAPAAVAEAGSLIKFASAEWKQNFAPVFGHWNDFNLMAHSAMDLGKDLFPKAIVKVPADETGACDLFGCLAGRQRASFLSVYFGSAWLVM